MVRHLIAHQSHTFCNIAHRLYACRVWLASTWCEIATAAHIVNLVVQGLLLVPPVVLIVVHHDVWDDAAGVGVDVLAGIVHHLGLPSWLVVIVHHVHNGLLASSIVVVVHHGRLLSSGVVHYGHLLASRIVRHWMLARSAEIWIIHRLLHPRRGVIVVHPRLLSWIFIHHSLTIHHLRLIVRIVVLLLLPEVVLPVRLPSGPHLRTSSIIIHESRIRLFLRWRVLLLLLRATLTSLEHQLTLINNRVRVVQAVLGEDVVGRLLTCWVVHHLHPNIILAHLLLLLCGRHLRLSL